MIQPRIDLSIYQLGLESRVRKYIKGPVARDLRRYLGVALPALQVYLAGDYEEFIDLFQQEAGYQPQQSVISYLISDKNTPTITIMHPQAYRTLYPLSFWTKLKHECVHIAWRRLTATWQPHWLSEGVAEYIAGQRLKLTGKSCWLYIDSERRYRLVSPYSVLRLKINDGYSNKNYWLGRFWVSILARRFGWRRIRNLIVALDGSDDRADFCLKFQRHFGVPFTRSGLQSIIIY